MSFDGPDDQRHLRAVMEGEQQHLTKAQGVRGKQVTRAYRRRIIMELRAAGLTYDQIVEQARNLGVRTSRAGVTMTVNKVLDELKAVDQDNAERARQLDLSRLDQIMASLWPKVKLGDVKAIREFRGCIDQRSRLLGTYAATKHEFHGKIEGVVSDQDREEIERLRDAFVASGADGDDVVDADVVEDPLLPAST